MGTNTSNRTSITPEFAVMLFDAMAEGVFALDKNGRIISWNPAMEKISGYPADEALGQNCSLLRFTECFGKTCPAGMSECGIFKHGRVNSKECRLRHKGGRHVPVMKSARVVTDDTGEVIGVVETVSDLTELQETRQQLAEAGRKLGELHRLDNIIGKSDAMNRVFAAVEAAAASDATVLIQGESGTGKELVAGAIHHNSVRSQGPMITVNCSALSESLLESELFGHARGSFTGAHRDRKGRFEEADGGTVFLDEIGEISPFIQVKLLRVLQERTVERVGESQKRFVDIRIITATNKNLLALVNSGEFRQDLYYRFKVFPIQVPPLRDRREDIPLLVEHFITMENSKTAKNIAGVTANTMRLLMDYNWPGNVRELENAIEHAFVLCAENGTISPFDLPVEIRKADYYAGHGDAGWLSVASPPRPLTRQSLLELLAACKWNKAEVARRAGVSRTAIWKQMKKWNIPLQPPEK